MNLSHRFEIPADLETAWTVLLDIPRIAPCMPGVELTEVVGEHTYKGLARVKIGPISLQFNGEAEIVEVDDSAHRAIVHGKGADGKGRGTADATIRFALSAEGPRKTAVQVETDLTLVGAVAQYGRASGLIDSVANQIISDFVKNLEVELAGSRPDGSDTQRATPGPTEDGTAKGEGASSVRPPMSSQSGAPVSGLRLLLRAIVAMLTGWFAKQNGTSRTGKQR
jgi:carbon monoxide dehydrogenase subunit G